MAVGVTVDDGRLGAAPEGKAGNGDAVRNSRAFVCPLQMLVGLDALGVLFDALLEFLRTALFRKAHLAKRDDLLGLSCRDGGMENI